LPSDYRRKQIEAKEFTDGSGGINGIQTIILRVQEEATDLTTCQHNDNCFGISKGSDIVPEVFVIFLGLQANTSNISWFVCFVCLCT
jgi:hypothetical protein